MNLRGADLRRVREEALENLERHGISTTLVVTVKRGVNDDEIGEIVRHALEWRCVRGITFQPVQDAGRNEGFDKSQTASCSPTSAGASSRTPACSAPPT